jgi:hypothetical protein
VPTKPPFEYELTPESVEAGLQRVTLTLRNLEDTDLINLTARLHSADTEQISVHGTGSTLPLLAVGEFQDIAFEITAQGTTWLYASIDGERGDEEFHWESSRMPIVVGRDVAEIVSFDALTEPYPTLGSAVPLEITIRGLAYNQGLGLEFWADTPDDNSVSIAKMPTEPIPEGETVRYTTQFRPKREGIYTLHAYVFAGVRQIGHVMADLSITR